MKINVLHPDEALRERNRQDLEHLFAQPGVKGRRPCPGCDQPCPCSKSPTCTCACSSSCVQCPANMSSEPERYPIESKIVPLVFEMFATGVTTPCWSCEGHTTEDGATILKIPRVWFYSSSTLYPRLVAEHADDLLFQKKIQNSWRVQVLGWANSLETRFSLEPIVETKKGSNLRVLQHEAAVIAESFAERLRHFAGLCLRSLKA